MNRFARPVVLFSLLGLFAAGAFAARQPDPDAAEAKIRLLSEALHARDIGDLTTARKNLQELLVLTPGDETVKRLLASLNRAPQKTVSVSGGTVAAPADAAAASEADALARAEEDRVGKLIEAAGTAARDARALVKQDKFTEASAIVERARAALPENNLTKDAIADLGIVNAEIAAAREKYLSDVAASAMAKAAEPAPKPAEAPAAVVVVETPAPAPASATPPPPANAEVTMLIARGRAQFFVGEPEIAAQTLARALALDPDNREAKNYLEQIALSHNSQTAGRTTTSAQMVNEVDSAWQRPGVFTEKEAAAAAKASPSPLLEKLDHIVLPSVNFSGMELSRVINTLSVISEEFDATGATPKGVNIVLLDQSNANPTVNITLRNLSLKRVLDFITDSVGYQYEVQADAVVVRPGGEQSTLDTQFFPISRSTVLRMTGQGRYAQSAASADPLEARGRGSSGPGRRRFLGRR